MSAQIYLRLTELDARFDALDRERQGWTEAISQVRQETEKLREERRNLKKETKELRDRVATLWALRESIEADVRKLCEGGRDILDPQAAELPRALKDMNFGAES